jgi:hypothetical protein
VDGLAVASFRHSIFSCPIELGETLPEINSFHAR